MSEQLSTASGASRVEVNGFDALRRSGQKVAVLMGGKASEKNVSIASGEAVLAALKSLDVDAVSINPADDMLANLTREKPAFAFIALHGKGGEDGRIQGLLEGLGVPYSGSGVLGSALAMDKIRSKQVWQAAGLPTPVFTRLNQQSDFAQVLQNLAGTAFVKPATEGSSFGMGIATSEADLRKAFDNACAFDANVLAEQVVQGDEYTVAILGDKALAPIRIETDRDFYDFQAKYQDNTTQFHIPCGLNTDDERRIQQLALQAFDALNCSVWGRVDIMRDNATNEFMLLEVNTVPGLTNHSLVPMAAKYAGLSFAELIKQIIDLSLAYR